MIRPMIPKEQLENRLQEIQENVFSNEHTETACQICKLYTCIYTQYFQVHGI